MVCARAAEQGGGAMGAIAPLNISEEGANPPPQYIYIYIYIYISEDGAKNGPRIC